MLTLKLFSTIPNLLFIKWVLPMIILLSTNMCYSNGDSSELEPLYNKISIIRNTNVDSVLFYSDILNSLAKKYDNKEYEYKSMRFKSKAYMKKGEYIKALELCKLSESFVLQHNLIQYNLEVEFYIGQTYLVAGFASEALKIFLNLKNKKNELSVQQQIDLDYYIGIAYVGIGEIDNGIRMIKQSINTDSEKNNLNKSFPSFILLSNMSENADTIRKYLGLADTLINRNPSWNYQKAVLLNNRALFNNAIGNKALSKSQYLKAIKAAKESGLKEMTSNLLNNYAYRLMNELNYDSTELILKQAIKIAREVNSIDMLGSLYDTYSDYYSYIHDYKLALNYMDSSVYYKNSFNEQKRIKESVFISTMFETEQMEKALLVQDIKIIRLLITVLSSISILLVLVVLLVFIRQRLRSAKSKLEIIKKDKKLEVADALIKGQNNERKRIAMDLHDGLGAQLGTLSLLIDGFISSHDKYPEISNNVRNIHKTVRELSHRMIPSQLEKSGLVSAINNVVSSVNKSGEFSIEFETNLGERLTERLELNIYYLVFELVNNATKHSTGDLILVQLIKHENIISLLVEDNGIDFDSKNKDGIGLTNLKARVEYLGGKLMMDIDGSETVFMIEIPI